MADVASKLVNLSARKLHSIHERLHKSEMSPAVLEVHHLTMNEMVRRGLELPEDDAWSEFEIQVDSIENADLTLLSESLPQGLVDEVIKSTGSAYADVQVILTVNGYEMRLDPREEVVKYNQNHDALGQFSSATGTAGGVEATGKPGSKTWSNSVSQLLNAGESPEIHAHDVGALLKDMAKRSDNPDITDLQIKGTLLFGGEGLGIKRLDMPQVPAKMRQQYLGDMAKQGITATRESIDPTLLKPSQKEISGSKVGGLYKHFQDEGGIPQDRAILISKDNYVIDGHHHWAAAVAFHLMGGGKSLPVLRLSANVREALSASVAWSKANGIEAQAIDARSSNLKKDLGWEPLEKFNPYHDQLGMFASGGGGGATTGLITSPNDPTPPMSQDKSAGVEHGPFAAQEASALRDRSLTNEPALTSAMKNLSKSMGGQMGGLAERVKSTESLTRKIAGDATAKRISLAEAASEISDPIRYTIVMPNATYTAGAASALTQLTDHGFVVRDVKNFWQIGDPVQGINIKASKNGNNFELQLHTSSSFAHSKNIHTTYEAWRVDPVAQSSYYAHSFMSRTAARDVSRPANFQTLLGIGVPVFQDYTTPRSRGILKKSVGKYEVSTMEEPKRYTLGAMYIPDQYDAHKEWTSPDELQSAVWQYVRSNDRRIRLQHNKTIVAGEWVEVMSFPYELTVPIHLPDGSTVEHTYPAHTVFLGVVWEPWAWELVKTGKILGYSIGGRAQRLYVELDKPTVVETVLSSKEGEEV